MSRSRNSNSRRSPSRNNNNNNQQQQQQQNNRPPLKRRPCQDIRGPQRLISYQIPAANPDKEINVIRAIIARETALEDLLEHVSKYKPTLVTEKNGGSMLNTVTACFGALDQKTTDLLLGLRITSVGVTDAIQDWRSQLTLPRPFVWQKKNYLQGMSCDVDFLHFDKCVASILGNGKTKRNPFVTEGRTVDDLYHYTWEIGDTPKSLDASGINGMRLQNAAIMIMEEEMRCGKADHRKPPPTWYIQRKKRMLAMGINLQAGADAPTSTAGKPKGKPSPKKRKKPQTPSLERIQETDEANKKSAKNSKKKKRKKLLEVVDVEKMEVDYEIKVCSARKKTWGWSRDGRIFVSSAEAWLLPLSKQSLSSTGTSSNSSNSMEDVKIKEEQKDLEDERTIVRAEIIMGLPSTNGWCGKQTCSTLTVSVAELKHGGFVPMSVLIDAPLVVAPPEEVAIGRRARKGKRNKKSKLLGKKKRGKGESITNAKKSKHLARVQIGDAAVAFLLDRLIPTIHGVAWEQDGSFLKRMHRKLLGPLSNGFFSSNRKKRKDSRMKFRTSLRLGNFWCVISAWIPQQKNGGGLELDICTITCSHSKRLTLDRQALERLLGAGLISIGGSKTKRPTSRSNSRPGSRSSSRPTSRGNGSKPSSRPSSRGNGSHGSRPNSRSNSRPSSRGNGSRPTSRNANRKARSGSVDNADKAVVIEYGELPPLDILTITVLQECIVVIETPSGPEFYAQPSSKLIEKTTKKMNHNVGNVIISGAVIAAANETSHEMTNDRGGTAGELLLSSGNVISQSNENDIDDKIDLENTLLSPPLTNVPLSTVATTTSGSTSGSTSDSTSGSVAVVKKKKRKKPSRIKILAQGTLVGGLYFLVDIYYHAKHNTFNVTATYPISGKSITMNLSAIDAERCVALLKIEMDEAKGEEKMGTKMNDGDDVDLIMQYGLMHREAKAVLSRLDLDYELPPGLMLRLDDEEGGEVSPNKLYALMAVSPERRAQMGVGDRPLSPMMLPIFSPGLVVKKEEDKKKETKEEKDRPLSPKSLAEQNEMKELNKEAEEKAAGHRETMSNAQVVSGGGGMMRISVIKR